MALGSAVLACLQPNHIGLCFWETQAYNVWKGMDRWTGEMYPLYACVSQKHLASVVMTVTDVLIAFQNINLCG